MPTRGAAGIAAGVLGVAFAISGIGNMSGTVDQAGLTVTSAWPAWLSPIGRGQQTRPFGNAHWRHLLIAVAAPAILLAIAGALVSRSDVGRGLWPDRRGHAEAARSLLSPAGLVWRLQRSAFIGWAAALTVFGLIFANLTRGASDGSRPSRADVVAVWSRSVPSQDSSDGQRQGGSGLSPLMPPPCARQA